MRYLPQLGEQYCDDVLRPAALTTMPSPLSAYRAHIFGLASRCAAF